MAIEHLWNHGSNAPDTEGHDNFDLTLGNVFQFAAAGTISSVWWYRYADDVATSRTARVWSIAGSQLASGTQTGLSGSGWKEIPLSASYHVNAGEFYVVSVDCPNPGHNGQFSSLGVAGLTNGNVKVPSSTEVTTGDQGRYSGTVGTFPASTDSNHGYGIDVSYEVDPPPVEPWIVAGDCTNSGNDTATTSWAVSYAAYANGDLQIFHIASDANVTHDWPATGPLGETINVLQDSYGPDAASNQRVSGFWFKGTGTKTAGTLTVTPSATEQWTATVVKMAAGRFNATTPITNGGVSSDDADVTNMPSPAWTAPATAGALPVVWYGIDTDPLVSAPSGWVAAANVDRGNVSGVLGVRTAKTTASESVASVNFTTTADSFAAFSYVINPPAASVSAITTAAAVRALGVVPVATATAHVSALTLAHAPARALGVIPVATATAHKASLALAAAPARALGVVPVATVTTHVSATTTAASARALGVVPVATATTFSAFVGAVRWYATVVGSVALAGSGAARALGVVPVASTTAHVSAVTTAAAARALGVVPIATVTAHVSAIADAAAVRALGVVPVASTTAHVAAATLAAAAARALGEVPVASTTANVAATTTAAAARALGVVPVATTTAHVSAIATAAAARALGLVPVAAAGGNVSALALAAAPVLALGQVPAAATTAHVSSTTTAAPARALGLVPVAVATAHVAALAAAAATRALGAVPIAFASQGTQALAGQVLVVGFVPVAAATAHVAGIATAAAARALGEVPAASTTAHVSAPAIAGTARALGAVPVVLSGQGAMAAAGAARALGVVPVAAVTAHVSAIAGAGTILALGSAPVAVAGDVKVALAAAGSAQVAGSVPVAVASDHKAATAEAGAAAALGSLPLGAVTLNAFAFTEGGVARVVGPIPYVLAGREAEAFPDPGVIRALGENVVAFVRPQRPTLPPAERPASAGGSAMRPVESGGTRSNAAPAVRPPARRVV